MLNIRQLLLLALAAVFANAKAAEPAPLRIGSLEDPVVAVPVQRLLSEAYARAGQRNLQFVPLPLRRAALMLKQGELDGDFLRTQAFFDANPAVLRVKVSMRNLTYWAHAKPPCARAVTLEVLAGSQVSYQMGAVVLEALLPASSLVPSASMADALQRVRSGSVRYSLMPMAPGMVTAVERRFPDLCRVRLPVLSLDMYHALAPHQAALLPGLEAALTSMQRDGSLARHWADGDRFQEDWTAEPKAMRPRGRRN